MHKKLYRSRDNRIISGLMGGLGEYFHMDPVIMRLVLIVVVLVSGIFPGVIAYIIAIFLIPESPAFTSAQFVNDDTAV